MRMYEPEKSEPFYHSLRVLRLLHCYPSNFDANKLKQYYFVSVLIKTTCSLCYFSLVMPHFVVVLKDKVPVNITADIIAIIGTGNCLLICALFELRLRRMSTLFTRVSDTSVFGMPNKFPESIRKFGLFSQMYFYYCLVGIAGYTIFITTFTGNCERKNSENNITEICGMMVPTWWPYGDLHGQTKVAVNIVYLIAILNFIPPSATLVFIMWEAIQIITVKAHHLKSLFRRSLNTKSPDLRKAQQRICLQYHQELIEIAKLTAQEATSLWGHASYILAIVLSCMATDMLKEYSFSSMIYLIGYVVATILGCQAGQNITDEMSNIQDAIYECKWYEADRKLAMNLKLAIARCQIPIYLNSIPFGVYNYNLLVVIVKTGYSYASLLNQTS